MDKLSSDVLVFIMVKNNNCEIEDIVEIHICELCAILRSRVLKRSIWALSRQHIQTLESPAFQLYSHGSSLLYDREHMLTQETPHAHGRLKRRRTAHHDHETRVNLEEQVQPRVTRYTVICPQEALPFHHSVVASEGLEHHSRSRCEHLQSIRRRNLRD